MTSPLYGRDDESARAYVRSLIGEDTFRKAEHLCGRQDEAFREEFEHILHLHLLRLESDERSKAVNLVRAVNGAIAAINALDLNTYDLVDAGMEDLARSKAITVHELSHQVLEVWRNGYAPDRLAPDVGKGSLKTLLSANECKASLHHLRELLLCADFAAMAIFAGNERRQGEHIGAEDRLVEEIQDLFERSDAAGGKAAEKRRAQLVRLAWDAARRHPSPNHPSTGDPIRIAKRVRKRRRDHEARAPR